MTDVAEHKRDRSAIAIELRDVSFAYRKSHPVLNRCSLPVRRGKVLALLGANGSGKSTLLKLAAGILKPDSGTVECSERVAYVPQTLALSFAYTVLDVVLMGRAQKIGLFGTPSRSDHDAAMLALSRTGMESFAGRSFDDLSGGERQLVALARAMTADAKILVLDEPASALDLRHQQWVLQWISKLAREHHMTVLFSTHNAQHADAVADDVALLHDASRISYGPVNELLRPEYVGELFGVEIARVALGDSSLLITRWNV